LVQFDVNAIHADSVRHLTLSFQVYKRILLRNNLNLRIVSMPGYKTTRSHAEGRRGQAGGGPGRLKT
ncbi:MAG: hypothetical protein QGM48_10495, partial [Actinomycetota bacterium]|nr:hypothetical protein [Actinomycetota bacterium]